MKRMQKLDMERIKLIQKKLNDKMTISIEQNKVQNLREGHVQVSNHIKEMDEYHEKMILEKLK